MTGHTHTTTQHSQMGFLDEAPLLSLRDIGPLLAPWWGGGFHVCPYCYPPIKKRTLLHGLSFGPDEKYKVGRCRHCGYYARFKHAMGFSEVYGQEGTVLEYGRNPCQSEK
jgi:hypothetical protein